MKLHMNYGSETGYEYMHTKRDNEEARRAYWTSQMELACNFMDKILEYPVEECGESLVSLTEIVMENGVEVQFANTRIANKHNRIFYLRRGLIKDFIAASKEMNNRGWILRVEDGFRSRAMQQDLALQEGIFDDVLRQVTWESKGNAPDPNLVLRRLGVLIASCPKIGTHMSGSAVDISVLRADNLAEIDRSGTYLEMSELTPMASPFASVDASRNRREISQIMHRHGFVAYPYEFWHYCKGDPYWELLTESGNPARYGPVDFDIARDTIKPIQNPKEPLHSLDDMVAHIELSISRGQEAGYQEL